MWKKLPFRDPTERIARYGPGFSKILSHMKPSDLLGGSPQERRTNNHTQSIDDSVIPAQISTDIEYHGNSTGSNFYPKASPRGGKTGF